MSRVYTIEFENATITNAGGSRELFYIEPVVNKPVKILGWKFVQISDLGDANEEVLRVRMIRGHTTASSGGANPDAAPLNPSDTAAAFDARTNDTTLASGGTAVNIESGGFNIRVGEQVFLPEQYRPAVTATQESIVLRLMAAPSEDMSMSGTLWVEEEG